MTRTRTRRAAAALLALAYLTACAPGKPSDAIWPSATPVPTPGERIPADLHEAFDAIQKEGGTNVQQLRIELQPGQTSGDVNGVSVYAAGSTPMSVHWEGRTRTVSRDALDAWMVRGMPAGATIDLGTLQVEPLLERAFAFGRDHRCYGATRKRDVRITVEALPAGHVLTTFSCDQRPRSVAAAEIDGRPVTLADNPEAAIQQLKDLSAQLSGTTELSMLSYHVEDTYTGGRAQAGKPTGKTLSGAPCHLEVMTNTDTDPIATVCREKPGVSLPAARYDAKALLSIPPQHGLKPDQPSWWIEGTGTDHGVEWGFSPHGGKAEATYDERGRRR